MVNTRLHGLYAITDPNITDESRTSEPVFKQAITLVLLGGTRLIQYRDKTDDTDKRLRQCELIRALCDDNDVVFIVNDDIELALRCNADGVHLGRDDTDISIARDQLGIDSIIGISCYNDMHLAIEAQQNGADYIAFGAFYASPTKPDAKVATTDLLIAAKQRLNIPVCAIGGITADNARPLIEAGADMTAVISGVFDQNDIRKSAAQLSRLFG